MAETEQKIKKKTKMSEYFSRVAETVKRLRNIVNAMTNKMWEIGKILDEQVQEFKKSGKYGMRDPITGKFLEGSFYVDIAKELNNDVTPAHLSSSVRFYRRYPDLADRIRKTGLSPTHYERLSHVSVKVADKFEKVASDEKLTVRQLKEKILPKRIDIQLSEVEEVYSDFVSALVNLEEAMEKLSKADLKVLSKTQKNGMARSTYVLMTRFVPRFVVHLGEEGAKLDPTFKKYVEKFI